MSPTSPPPAGRVFTIHHMPRRNVGVDGRGAFISGPTDKIALVIVSERKQDLEDIEGI